MYKTTWSWLHFTYSVIFYQRAHKYWTVIQPVLRTCTRAVKRKEEYVILGLRACVWGSRASRENRKPALRAFVLPITYVLAAYPRSIASQSKKTKKITLWNCVWQQILKNIYIYRCIILTGHLWVALPVCKWNDCDENRTFFLLPCKWNLLSQKRFALSLGWKVRVCGTRKLPVDNVYFILIKKSRKGRIS